MLFKDIFVEFRVFIIIRFLLNKFQCDRKSNIEHRKYQIWLPVGKLINLPCDPFLSKDDANKSHEISLKLAAVEWYDIGGFYLRTGFILPVRVVDEKFLHGLICNFFDRNGNIFRHIEHHVIIYQQPIVLWIYKINLNKFHLMTKDNILTNDFEILFRNISLICNSICEKFDFCYYQFVFFHKSPYDEYYFNSDDESNSHIENQINKLLDYGQPLSFYFRMEFLNYSDLIINPFSNKFKIYIIEKRNVFFSQMTKSIIDMYLMRYIIYDNSNKSNIEMEIICPGGSEEIVGFILCRECNAGYYAKPGGRCQPCEFGTFQGSIGSSECNKCPFIYKTLKRASTKEQDCIYDGQITTAAFYYYSERIWENFVTSYRTFSFGFLLITLIYIMISILLIGWLSYRIHLYRKIRRRQNLAFEQLLSACTMGNINLNINE